MPVNIDDGIKSKMLDAMRNEVAGGTLEIGTANMRTTLAAFKLSGTAGSVSTTAWKLEFMDLAVDAIVGGRAEAARIKDSSGKPRITGLSVGMSGSAKDVILSNTQINNGQRVQIDGEQVIEHV